jgi:hypothetical protein
MKGTRHNIDAARLNIEAARPKLITSAILSISY